MTAGTTDRQGEGDETKEAHDGATLMHMHLHRNLTQLDTTISWRAALFAVSFIVQIEIGWKEMRREIERYMMVGGREQIGSISHTRSLPYSRH